MAGWGFPKSYQRGGTRSKAEGLGGVQWSTRYVGRSGYERCMGLVER